MGLVKISDLPNLTTGNVSSNDFIPVVDIPPSGTTRTKKMLLQDLFTIAPVKSVNGLTTGDVSLASTHLTDASAIGRILNINGFSSGNVSLGSSNLTNASDIAHHSELGSVQEFTNEYNNPTSAQLQTEYEELARLLGTDQNNLRVSLFAVQQTANNAMPTSTANATFATKVSLGEFTKSLDIIANHYTKPETDAKYATKVSLGDYTTSSDIINAHYTKSEVDTLIANNSGTASANFEVNHLVADSASISNLTRSASLSTSGNVSVGGDLSVVGDLNLLRAEIGDGTSSATGTNSTLFVHGNAYVKGTLVSDALEILGSTKIKNTQVVEVSDDFILLNKDNPATSGGGVQVYQASSSNLASLEWDEVNQIWNFKIGGQLADIGANNLGTGGAITSIPTTTNVFSDDAIVSINSSNQFVEIREQISLGTKIGSYRVQTSCCTTDWSSYTSLTDLRALTLRVTNNLCVDISNKQIQDGFDQAQSVFEATFVATGADSSFNTGDFDSPSTEITTSITPNGTGGGSTSVSLGNRTLQGATFALTLDDSGSMSNRIGYSTDGFNYIKDFLETLLYDSASERDQFVKFHKNSDERWLQWLGTNYGGSQFKIAMINESSPNYHAFDGQPFPKSPFLGSDIASYRQTRINAKNSNYIHKAVLFDPHDYPMFTAHVEDIVTNHTENIERGTPPQDAEGLAEYVISRLGLPEKPTENIAQLTALDDGQYTDRVKWSATSPLQKRTGIYGSAGSVIYTQSHWEVEIYNKLANTSLNLETTINLGTKLPSTIEYMVTGNEPTKSFYAVVKSKSTSVAYDDGVSQSINCNLL